jgi:glycosyltransferase involved in cell wall biosynthesis
VGREAFDYPEQPGHSVVFLGRLEYVNKGLDLLLMAWSAICQSIDAELVVAGDGPEADLVKREAKRLGVGDRIKFVGWLTGADKWALLSQARVVVVPSRHETFGMVALEALAASTPVIAFDIPGLREVVPLDAGWRLPPFDVQLLSAKIREVYTHPQVAVAAGRAGRRFAANFDWEALAARQDDVYRSALSEGAKRTMPGGHS